MEIAQAGLWEWDVRSGKFQLSEILRDIMGVPAGHLEVDYRDMLAAVHPEERAQADATIRKALSTHSDYQDELRMQRADGRVYWIALRGAGEYDADGAPLRMLGVASDVTERRRAQIALEASEERFRTLVEATSSIVWMADAGGGLKDISQSFERYTGRKVEDGLKDGWAADLHPEDWERTVAVWTRAIATGEPLYNEFRLRSVEGDYRYFSAQATPLRGTDGRVREWIGVCTDIDQRKQAEAKLERLHRQLAESSRSAGMAEIATNVLHNVGNVLNSVNVSAGLVSERIGKSKLSGLARIVALLQEHQADLPAFFGGDPKGKLVPAYLDQLAGHLRGEQEEVLKELELLRANIDHIKKIVAMQQSYARVSGVSERISAIDLVEDSLRLNEASRNRHRIKVVREFEAAPYIHIDKHKVLQILVNLLSNAKHACDDSGRSDKQITLHVSTADGRVRLEVRDNGIGIPAENLPRIFNFGFTTKRQGHGFGLHSAALAAKELGGTLSARSAGSGQGAAFTLELPLPAGPHTP